MYFAGVLAKASSKRWKIKRELESHPLIQVEEYSNVGDLMQAVRDRRLSLIILKVEKFKNSHIDTVRNLRVQIPWVSVLMVADEISDSLRYGFSKLEIPGAGILDLRHEISDLCSLVERLSRKKDKVVRTHRRFDTYENAAVSMESGHIGDATLVNISAGGACIRMHNQGLQEGETVAVKVLQGTDRAFVIEGKIVWSRNNNHLLGIEFDRVRTNVAGVLAQVAA